MSIIERLKKLRDINDYDYKKLEEKTGIESKRLKNLFNKRGVLTGEELAIICSKLKEHREWIMTGEETEAGQISPMTKKAQELLKEAAKGTN